MSFEPLTLSGFHMFKLRDRSIAVEGYKEIMYQIRTIIWTIFFLFLPYLSTGLTRKIYEPQSCNKSGGRAKLLGAPFGQVPTDGGCCGRTSALQPGLYRWHYMGCHLHYSLSRSWQAYKNLFQSAPSHCKLACITLKLYGLLITMVTWPTRTYPIGNTLTAISTRANITIIVVVLGLHKPIP